MKTLDNMTQDELDILQSRLESATDVIHEMTVIVANTRVDRHQMKFKGITPQGDTNTCCKTPPETIKKVVEAVCEHMGINPDDVVVTKLA